ncbi:MAG: Hsp20/alpha crystallin family protein [Verrucomicrobiota bacterium]
MNNNLPTTTPNACATTDGENQCSPRERVVRPRYESARKEAGVDLRIFVPGVDKSSVNVSVDEGILTVAAKRTDGVNEAWRPLFSEIERADYQLKLELKSEFDTDKIGAKVEDGVLSLNIPFAESAKPREIAVE